MSRYNIIRKLRIGIIGWWIIWFFVAAAIYGGLSFKVSALVLISILGFYLGSFSFFPRGVKEKRHYNRIISSVKFPVFSLSIIISYQLFLNLKSLRAINMLGSGFREEYFSGAIHGSGTSFVLYEQLMIPFGIYIISLWACRRQRGGWWFIFTITFFSLDALLKYGRFPLYFCVFFLIMGHLIGIFKLTFFRIIPLLLALPVSTVYLLLARKSFVGVIDSNLIASIFREAIIKYHIMGFFILDNFMDKPDFYTASIFPSYTFGYFQYILSLILRRIGISIEYPQQILNIALTNPIYIEKIGFANAFSTNILPFYLDGGIIFSFLMFYLFGFLLRKGPSSSFQNLSPINVIAAFVMVFGIFQPVAITGYFFLPIMIHALFELISRVIRVEPRKISLQFNFNTVKKKSL
jgi:hypothetical protein